MTRSRSKALLARCALAGASLGLAASLGTACGSDVTSPTASPGPSASAPGTAAPPPTSSPPDPGEDAGDAGADGGSNLPSLAAIFSNGSLWRPVSDSGHCNLNEWTLTTEPFPKRTWTTCAPGCKVAPIEPQFDVSTATADIPAAGKYVQGATYILASIRSKLGEIERVERLDDETTVAAVMSKAPGPCNLGSWGGAAPFALAMYDNAVGKTRFGRVVPGSPIGWLTNWIPNVPPSPGERYVLGERVGMGPNLYESGLNFPSPAGGGRFADVEGDLLVGGGNGDPVLHGYRVGVGTWTIVDESGEGRTPLAIRMNGGKIVYVSGVLDGEVWKDIRWRWLSSDVDAGVTLHDGPDIAGSLVDDVQTDGDWSAAHSCDVVSQKCFLDVWQISTGATYRVPERSGRRWRKLFAVSPTEVVSGEGTIGGSPSEIERLVRIELTALPALAASGWP